MRGNVRHFYEFGPFRLDADKHRLTRDGELVHLSPKAGEALLVLVRNPGKLLEREALMQAVWADTFVEDANLTVAISHLRKALGQNGESSEYIETVPRAGYRFVADVREVVEDPAPLIIEKRTLSRTVIEEETTPEPSPIVPTRSPNTRALPATRTRTKPLVLAAIGLVVATSLGLVWALRRNTAVSSPTQIRSIAVLPLKSFGQSAEDENLRLRITDALITRLGGLSGISVRPTDSVLRFANEQTNAVEAGHQLEVDAVLDGRVQTEGDRLRITMQMISVQTGEQIWSAQFDGKQNEILNLQDKISAHLVPRLSTPTTLAKNPTTHAEAYENYLKGRYLWNRRARAELQQAIEYFEKAIALDPNFALAYAGLADVYAILGGSEEGPAPTSYILAKRMAEQALSIDPNLSEAFAALGWIQYRYEWNWTEAEKSFARAIALNPNNPEAHHWRGLNFLALGMTEEYFASMEQARLRGPLIKPISENYHRVVLKKEGCDKAFQYLVKHHALYQTALSEQVTLTGMHHVLCSEYPKAIETMEQIPLEQLPVKAKAFLAVSYARTGRRQDALKILELLNKSASTWKFYLVPYIQVALGNVEAAFANLERGITAHDVRFTRLKHDEFFEPLHSDPRFKRLLRKMNLPA